MQNELDAKNRELQEAIEKQAELERKLTEQAVSLKLMEQKNSIQINKSPISHQISSESTDTLEELSISPVVITTIPSVIPIGLFNILIK